MIQATVKESQWLAALELLSSWVPPVDSILFVSPHPDDETLAAGGLIAAQRAKGVDVVVAAVTDGENAYPDCPNLGKTRIIEQTAALARLQVCEEKIVRFAFPDSSVEAHEQELIDKLLPFADKNTHILAPWRGDLHPDHQACGRAAEHVARLTGASLSSYFFWTWHWGHPASIESLKLRRFALNDELLTAKSDALLCHRSQLIREGGDPILPESLLAPARRPFEVFAVA